MMINCCCGLKKSLIDSSNDCLFQLKINFPVFIFFSVTSKKAESFKMATVASKKAQKAEDFAISQSLLDIDEPDALRPGMCSSHVFTNFQSKVCPEKK